MLMHTFKLRICVAYDTHTHICSQFMCGGHTSNRETKWSTTTRHNCFHDAKLICPPMPLFIKMSEFKRQLKMG